MKNPLTFTCSGEFCNLILVLDPDRDLILNTKSGNDQCIDSKKNLSKTDRDIQARDRAYRIASKVLARSELSRLEDSGNLMRLRIPDRINPCEMKYISEDSVQTSKREFRSTLLELKLAEENNRSWRVEGDEHFGRESVPSLSSISNNCTPVENSKGMVAVCSICFHVYNLLHRVRTLLSYQSKSTVNTEVETPTSAQPCVSFDQDEKNEMLRKGPRWEKFSAWKQVTHLPVMNRCDEPRQVTFTPHLNGIADLLEDFEAAKRSIEETCNNIMNHENGENKYAGFGAILHEKSHTETKDATENKTSAFYTKSPIKVKEPIQKTNSNQDHKRQPITNSIKAAAAESEVNDDQQMMMSIFHLDDSTSLPYRILKNRASHTNESSTTPLFYNLIVCNDIFDHYERFIALFMPMVMRYPSLQVLLWNYPGQALTTYANNISMDNIFFSDCLHKLLSWVGDSGTKEFETTRPFYIMGVGCGGSVATLFASRHQEQSLRAILLINPLLFIDSHLASVVHDCRNAFSCSPEARPDIPTYFFSRFLFSTEYLQRVSAPQALNNYTSEPNPITIKGRLKLCQAVLNFVDVRDNIQSIHRPIISIHGQSSCFVRPSQAAYLLNGRHCCETIFQALRGKANSSIVYMVKGGHELMQEKRGSMSILIEQLLTKYHDMFEVIPSADLFALKNTAPNDPSTVNRMERIVLINNPDVKCKKISPDSNLHDAGNKPCSDHNETLRWEAYKKEIEKKLKPLNRRMKRRVRQRDDIVALSQTSLQQGSPNTLIVLDPHKPSFERYENKVYRPGSSIIYPDPDSLPRVKELMEWRLRRNEKRLSHFHRAALVIQKALRMNFSKTIFSRIKKDASAILIQKYFRGMLGKKECIKIRHELWAAKLVQRTYRGHLGRSKSYGIRMAIACQSKIARRWRGLRARRVVQNLLKYRFNAATVLQSFWRKYKARCFLKWLRVCRRSSIYIQRVFRGYKGRRKAASERDMYIFSRSQCSGIEMGRRLLAEHKLSANRLRSELNIIDQEKNAIKVRLDELREEILSFEKNVSELERQMHKICIFEREHPTAAAGSGKFELKEKKMRLDEEFTLVLTRINDRRNLLQELEQKLNSLNSEREEKSGELKSLERKLVFLLEDQETALNEILLRQKKNECDAQKATIAHKDLSNETEVNELKKGNFSYSHDNSRRHTEKLMESTETMMKFGFMSMSMTYFSSLNMIKAMKSVAVQNPMVTEDINHGDLSREVALIKNIPNKIHGSIDNTQIDVELWDVDQVVKWLHSIHLRQYETAFREGSVDGPFLCQLTDEDLRFALGIEHKLHRKKILYYISQLVTPKSSTRLEPAEVNDITVKDDEPSYHTPSRNFYRDPAQKNLYPSIQELFTWIKTQKFNLIQEALKNIPNRRFDKCVLRVQFFEGVGTVYLEAYERELFHLNKVDDHGNSPMHIAAQNGALRIAKLLFDKGANPNHQNKQGQTPGHFAVAYQFFDFASWLFDERGANADDLLANMYGLGPYDGLITDGSL